MTATINAAIDCSIPHNIPQMGTCHFHQRQDISLLSLLLFAVTMVMVENYHHTCQIFPLSRNLSSLMTPKN